MAPAAGATHGHAAAGFDEDVASGQIIADRYVLFDRIGEGGMAVVHRGHDRLLDRDVAIKLLRRGYAEDPDFIRRFRREARHAAALHHPRIVTIFDVGVDAATGADFIVMQLVDGSTLAAVLAERGPLPVGQAVRIAIETAEALDAAHRRGIIHRDVKPGNILLDADGSIRVVDFGIARATGESGGTTSGIVIGSPEYVSPEQVVGDVVTPASDVFSLGVVLYEMLTGRHPYDGTSAASIALQRLRLTPPPPSAIRADVPAELDAIVMRCLARDPAARQPSAADVAVELSEFRLRRGGGVRRPDARARGPRPRGSEDRTPRGAAKPSAVGTSGGGNAIRDGRAVAGAGPPRHGPERRRRPVPAAALLPILGLLFVALAGAVALGSTNRETASRPTDSTGVPSPQRSSSPGGAASASLSASLASSASPSPATHPSAATQPKPRATARPATTSRPTVPRGTASPGRTVETFYELVAQHRFDDAAALWSQRMRTQYPPLQYIDGRFAPTTAIDILRLATTAESRASGTAKVAVDLIEHRDDGSTRHWVGSWDLVLGDAGWLMDRPRF